MPKRKWKVQEKLAAAKKDWATVCPSSKKFLTGEGHNRDEAVQRRMGKEVTAQCEEAAQNFFFRMYSDVEEYFATWHSMPKAFNCLLDAELAPHFSHKVLAHFHPASLIVCCL
jgi:hypothetical protein